jgi:exopolysaccharide production protein ExoZ
VIKELVGIQYLRGTAAAMVVLHHLRFNETELGPFGVAIFFVISGFVMWITTASAQSMPTQFWLRRLQRILPLYWLFLSLLIVIALLAPQFLKSTAITPESAVKSFLFIPHYHAVQKFIAPILIPGWSLNYEMFFYFLFGLALLIESLDLRAVAIGAILGGLVLIGLSFNPHDAIAATYTSPNLLLFLDGVALAILYRAPDLKGAAPGLALLSVGLLFRWLGLPGSYDMLTSFLGIAPALIVGAILVLEPTIRRAPSVVLHTIGNASYSIYLSHLFFLRFFELSWRHFVAFAASGVWGVTYVGSAFVFAIAGGVAVHYFVERPMLVLFHRRKLAVGPA